MANRHRCRKPSWAAPAWLAAAALLLGCAGAGCAGVADSEWPMFHHDNLHTGRSPLPGPGVASLGPPPLPALRWFQGSSFAPEESGHRAPGPQGVMWSSPAQGSGASNARKVWHLHSAPWTLNGGSIGVAQLRSEAPETTTPQSLAAPGSYDFATSAAINFGVGSHRQDNLTFRNLDPSRDDAILPAGTWTFSFIGEANVTAPDQAQARFHVFAFPQGNLAALPALPLFSTSVVEMGTGRRRYEASVDAPQINLSAVLPGVPGQFVGILVRVEMTTSGAATAALWFDGTTRTRVITPIAEPAVRVGCQDGSVYAVNASTGNVMWSYWTGWPVGVAAGYKTAVRSSPALGDAGEAFFGTEEAPDATTGFVKGRFYSVGDDGSLRWVHPSSRRTFNLRTTLDTDPGAPATRRQMTFRAGSTLGGDTSTFAQSGTSTDFTQFVPAATSIPVPARPESVTESGWIGRTDFTGRVMPAGRFRFTLSYLITGSGQLPRARLWYRISKVTAPTGGSVGYGVELIGWTQAEVGETLMPQSFGAIQVATIDSARLDETMFFSGEYLFVELGIQQTVPMTDAAGGWHLLLDDPVDATTMTTGLISDDAVGAVTSSPALSEENTAYAADSDANMWALDDAAAEDLGAGDMVRWTKWMGTGHGVEMSSPALDQTTGRNHVYVGTTGGLVFAFDASTGASLWDLTAPAVGRTVASPAIGENGDIYIGSDLGRMYALTSGGAVRWVYPALVDPALGPIRSTVAISANGRALYFGCGDNPATGAVNEAGLHAIRLNDDGTFNSYLGQVATPTAVQSSPAIGSGGQRLRYFFRSDSVIPGPAPMPDRWNLGVADSGAHCIDLQRTTPNAPAIGSPVPLQGWLSPAFAAGERLQLGEWSFALQHATSMAAGPQALHYRVSRVSLDGANNVILERVLTGGTDGWWVAGSALRPATYYLHQEGGGALYDNSPPNDPTQTLSGNPLGGEIALGAFVTPFGDPNAMHLCPGTWRFNFRAAATGADNAIRFRVMRRPTLGPDVLLFDSGFSSTLDSTPTDYTIASAQPGFAMASTGDRLVVIVLASGTGVVDFQYEGATSARVAGPAPRVTQFSPSLAGTTFAAGERLYVEFAVERGVGDPDWSLLNSSLSSVRTAPLVAPGEQVFFGCNDGLVRSWRMNFNASGIPTGFEPLITWQWPAAGQAAYVSSPAVGQGITPGAGADPALFASGGDGVLACLGPVGTEGPWEDVLPPPVPLQGDLLRITKSADKQSANTGDSVTFTIRVQNPSLPDFFGGATDAQSVTITDTVPAGMNYGSSNPPGTYAGGVITWNLGMIAAQESQTLTFTGTVTATGTAPDGSPGGIDPINPPRVEVSHIDYADQNPDDSDGPYTPNINDRTTRWGEYLYVRVTGRGEPQTVQNRARADWLYGAGAQLAQSNASSFYAGWGKRYQLEFEYDPANDPTPGPPENQIANDPLRKISFTTNLELAGSGQRTGRNEEAYDPSGAGALSGKYVSVYKVQLAPRAYPYGPTAASVAQHPNRPWTPYFWKVRVRQQSPTGGFAPLIGWDRRDDPATPRSSSPTGKQGDAEYDMRVANPLASSAGLIGVAANPGASSARTAFTLTNRTRFSLTGAGLMPRSVVRWADSDLGQSAALFPDYDPRKENYLPAPRLEFSPAEHTSLAPGGVRTVALSGQAPKHLYPGTYSAPSASALTSELALYVDLNGNGSWDPGEAYLEQPATGANEWDTPVAAPVFQVQVPTMDALRGESETLDLGRVAVGSQYPGMAAVPVENVGNVAVSVAPTASALARADASGNGTAVLGGGAVTWSTSPLMVAKTPVGSVVPLVTAAGASLSFLPGPPTGAPPDQPAGHYVGRFSVGGPLRVQLAEARKTGFDPAGGAPVSVPGSDVWPAVGFYGLDQMNLFWSSSQKPDGAGSWLVPDASDPMSLYAVSLTRDVVAGIYAWLPLLQYPAPPAVDPMLVPVEPAPDAKSWLRHWMPGYGADMGNLEIPGTTRAELLAWSASRLRDQGQRWDNRLLWTEWGQGAPGDISDGPPVSQRGTAELQRAIIESAPKSRPSVARVWQGTPNQYAWVVYGQGSGESSGLQFMEMQRAGGTGAWLAAGKYALPTSRALAYAADPSALAFPSEYYSDTDGDGQWGGELWVDENGNLQWDAAPSVLHAVFSARSQLRGNADIYCARWRVQDANGLIEPQLIRFRRIGVAPQPPEEAEKLSSRVFASRHIEWAVGGALWPVIYVTDNIGNLSAIYDPSTNPPVYDARTARYVVEQASYYLADGATLVTGRRVEFDAAAGAVYFPQAPNTVYIEYSPTLMRLTAHRGRDATPSAFIETYRYWQGTPPHRQPANFRARLWLFWVRSGTAGLAPRLYYKTYRFAPHPLAVVAAPEDTGWVEETRANDAAFTVDVGEQAVPLSRSVNEFGLSVAKDPRWPQVWLAWSSTRGVPLGQTSDPLQSTAGTVNADVYLEPFAPALPDN